MHLELAPKNRFQQNFTDCILICFVEIDMASQTAEEDDDQEDFVPTELTWSISASALKMTEENFNALLIEETQRDCELNENYQYGLTLIHCQITKHDARSSSDVDHCVRLD